MRKRFLIVAIVAASVTSVTAGVIAILGLAGGSDPEARTLMWGLVAVLSGLASVFGVAMLAVATGRTNKSIAAASAAQRATQTAVARLREDLSALTDAVADVEHYVRVQEPPPPPRQDWHFPSRDARPNPLPNDERPLLALGVSTFQRRQYLERCVETFVETRSDRFRWVLIVADDGSSDGTLDYLADLRVPECQVIVVYNDRATITGQTNTIFLAAEATQFDFGIKVDDDISFTKRGWDELYYDTAMRTGVHHLAFHDPQWRRPRHTFVRDGLRSSVNAMDSLGWLYTFSPEVLATVGYLDEDAFPFRGHGHLDFTTRCCRAGFNDEQTLWDADGAPDYVSMWDREEYASVTDWRSPEIVQYFTPRERARRRAIIRDESRLYVSPSLDVTSRVRLEPESPGLSNAISSLPRFSVA